MRIGWAMQISPGGQAEKKSGKDATPRRCCSGGLWPPDPTFEKSSAINGQDARWPHSQDGCATTSHESFFARRDFLRNSAGAHFHHELSRCDVFLVFLVATDLGRIEAPLR